MAWDSGALKKAVREKIGDHKFIVISNREPYIHRHGSKGIVCERPVSGMATALDPVLQACGGTWVAHGSGEADREAADMRGRVAVPPGKFSYTLRRVWLTPEEELGYYYGFSNEALWPLCHIAYTQPVFRQSDWETYRRVNEKFADAVLEEMNSDTGFVFIQDYHFTLLPRILKQRRPDLIVAQFWHIPWPNREAFRICPWGEEILDGLLGNDLLGFHIRYHCQNFLETVDRSIEAKVDSERFSVMRGGRETLVRPFPISIDFFQLEKLGNSAGVLERSEELRREHRLAGKLVGIGIDRMDYIKGIPERLAGVDRFFEKYPDYLGRFTFLQLGPGSRTEIPKYKEHNLAVQNLAAEINRRYGSSSWQPVVLLQAHLPPEEVAACFRLADLCLVSSLHDGMNLVAKEYVAARGDGEGVLVLSRFTGAARELEQAVLVNPYATDELADALKTALEMPPEEKRKRMEKMRETVRENNIYRWAGKIIAELNRRL
jgi:trehalose 6-phosphate synthase